MKNILSSQWCICRPERETGKKLRCFWILVLVCNARVKLPYSQLSLSLCFSAEAGGKKLRSTIQRSTETGLAVEMRSRMTRQASRESTDGSMNSYSSEGKWVTKQLNFWICRLTQTELSYISKWFERLNLCKSYFSQSHLPWCKTLLWKPVQWFPGWPWPRPARGKADASHTPYG